MSSQYCILGLLFQSSVLTRPCPWIYCISWGRKEWLKEKEKECSVIVMVTGESNKLSNSKLFKQKNFIVFPHLKFSMGVPNWGKSVSRRDLKVDFFLSHHSLSLMSGIQGCPYHLQKPMKREKPWNVLLGVAYSPSMDRLLSLLVSFRGGKLNPLTTPTCKSGWERWSSLVPRNRGGELLASLPQKREREEKG